MDGFERRRQQKKEAILHAALELFKQHGFNKVSIADIASKASVSQVSIYNFFISKENLKKELLKTLWDNYYHMMLSNMESESSLRQKIEKLFYNIVTFSRNYSMNFMMESIRNQMEKEENTGEMQLQKIQEMTIDLLEQGKSAGVIKNTISTQVMIGYIEIFRFYFINNQEAVVKYDQNPELLAKMISLYLNALLA